MLAGTGQQIKILEAMAHGLAVVTIRRGLEKPAVEHGVTGFVANGPEEFADYTSHMWKDKALG